MQVDGIKVFLPMEPPTITAQEQRVGVNSKTGKPYVYKNERLLDARQKLRAFVANVRPVTPMEGPLRLIVKWCFLDKYKHHKHGEYKRTKPDTDNLQKMLKDVMTETHWWKDDAQVASEIIEKFWVRYSPGIGIEVIPIDASETASRRSTAPTRD